MKVLAVLSIFAILSYCVTSGFIKTRIGLPSKFKYTSNNLRVEIEKEIGPRDTKVALDLCKTCVEFTGEAINDLLNIILNAGVVSVCSDVCGALENKTGSQVLGAVCTILCDIVGVEEFVKLIQKADLDPIYFCELINTCGINDQGDAKITNLTVSPLSGPQGTDFLIDLVYVSKNGTGTGEIVVDVDTVDGIPVGGSFLNEKQNAGTYGAKIRIEARPDPSCDPTQQPCEMWFSGKYMVNVNVCNGECGSKHPHSQIYDKGSVNFTVT